MVRKNILGQSIQHDRCLTHCLNDDSCPVLQDLMQNINQ